MAAFCQVDVSSERWSERLKHTEPAAFSSSLSVYSGLEPSRGINPNPAAACCFDEAVTRMSSISPSVSLCAGVPGSSRVKFVTLCAAGGFTGSADMEGV